MTKYETKTYKDPTRFGGVIYLSDFETDYRGKDQKESSIAKRIESDFKFDHQCRKNIRDRNKRKEFSSNG